ncbi:MAG: type VI secretion system ATPase TssH [Gammaproteobacteria bacterium]|nr:type VI secretion system ATPase TssH [Gammaproteobacteria bacterium]
MAQISRVALFGKLNSVTYRAIEGATVFCKLRGNPYVEVAHWLHQLLQLQDSDVHRLVQHFSLDAGRLSKDLLEALDKLPRGASSVSDLSAHVEELVQEGWLYASLLFNRTRVRSGHLLLGGLRSPQLRNVLLSISKEFAKISSDMLSDRLGEIVAGSPEDDAGAELGGERAAAEGGEPSPAALGKQEALIKYTVDFTAQAREGKLDPVLGRDQEIRQMIDILMRRRQNNPLLTGEAGVGKTAVVEGFAARVAAGDVPPAMQNVAVRALDVGLLQAGASMKGEFESRLRSVIDEVQAAAQPVILFIDEAHTLVGAGGAAGTGDAANLLKPALARGTLRTIAATTWAEYKKHIEKDPALTRRFQVVQVHEPDELKAINMMRGITVVMEKHHKVQILDEAIEAAVKLSHRYIPARQLPDKAVSLLDTACARVAVSQHGTPAQIEDIRRRIEALEAEQEILTREHAVGIETAEREQSVATALVAERESLGALETRWEAERAVVDEVLDLRHKLRPPPAGGAEAEGDDGTASEAVPDEAEREHMRARLIQCQEELKAMQGESPLILPVVDAQAVGVIVADWTGIPVGRMVKDEIRTVLHLEELLAKRVIGQDHALATIAKRIRTSRAHLDNPNRPIGVFLLAGPSGVGKTETALALAEVLYGGDHNVITINMSEFQEAHTVSTLKGAPPGYVGYGEGGVLTEAVRRRPYSVILLDEVEKAHPDVHEIFFQVFDKGVMEDGEGRMIDFKNTLILLTTNAGTDLVMSLCNDPELLPDPEALNKAMRDPLLKVFPPALLGRMVSIPYYPLSDTIMGDIIRLQIGRIQGRVEEHYGVALTYDESVVQHIAKMCTEVESGGRMIDSILTNSILPRISDEFLQRTMDGRTFGGIAIGTDAQGFTYSVSE